VGGWWWMVDRWLGWWMGGGWVESAGIGTCANVSVRGLGMLWRVWVGRLNIHVHPSPQHQPPTPSLTFIDLPSFLSSMASVMLPTQGWRKKWVQIRKPYVFISDHEKDPVMRTAIHMNEIKIQYSEEQGKMMGMPHIFTLCTKHRGLLLQAVRT